jgi:arsenate reductase-like glutaredoxin family protein
MKKLNYLLVIFILSACSSVKLADSWKRKDCINYAPHNVLIVGLSQNLPATKNI